jgi:uncharacterized membrane protein YecN with MAPEG domain
MEIATIIVMLALVEYTWFTIRVGASREKHGIKAPATFGDETWERKFRVQQNTLEQLIIFIPATYAFAYYLSTTWVLLPAAMFIIGRFLYSGEYISKPESRVPGMSLTLLANAILVVGTLGKLVWGLV